ncbi:hypothetical protein EV207_11515 [Scopulibacillus darangshiensis]|uniref:Uncharacterized protein n=1 Tax=Scopulibacillus darangshiensis TaxID=442528 RepID=A0A4R2P286_9BACL|nr:hypothetical protein [Scopulibacillus darangshiensis]TCP28790.1 hypothetical protein EV207_11515 [Scopulibacillus darangshiensis]
MRLIAEIGDKAELDEFSKKLSHDRDAIHLSLEFDGIMKERGIKLSLDEVHFTQASFAFWNIQEQMITPMAHCAPAGFGKSTMLELWGAYNGKHKSSLWGAIVAKPKVEQVIEFTNKINSQTNGTARAILGKGQFETDKEYKEQFKFQESAPLLVMTHKMLEVLVSQGRLPQFSKWIDGEGNARRRTTLIIDERPMFAETSTLTPSTIEKLIDLVRGVSLASSGREKAYYADIQKVAEKLKTELKKPIQKDSRTVYTVPAIDPLWEVPNELANDWMKNIDILGNEHTLLGIFEEAIKRGGTCQVSGSEGNVGTSLIIGRQIWQNVTYMNTHILDGTAMGDMNYGFRPFNKIAPVIPESAYQGTTIKNCYKHNLGKQFFKNNVKAIDKTVQLAKELCKEHKTLLVVVYKKLYDEYNKKLAKEMALGKIELKYFDDERSTNSYSHCDGILFLGIHRKAVGYYPEITKVVTGDEVNADYATSGGLKFKNEPVQEYFISDQLTDRLQGIARTRNYKSEVSTTVYMFSMDKELPEKVIEEFDGAQLEEWGLPFSLTDEAKRKKKSIDYYMDYLRAGDFSGDGVKCSYIYKEALEIERTTFARIKKAPEVFDLMNELGIAYNSKGTRIVKLQK